MRTAVHPVNAAPLATSAAQADAAPMTAAPSDLGAPGEWALLVGALLGVAAARFVTVGMFRKDRTPLGTRKQHRDGRHSVNAPPACPNPPEEAGDAPAALRRRGRGR